VIVFTLLSSANAIGVVATNLHALFVDLKLLWVQQMHKLAVDSRAHVTIKVLAYGQVVQQLKQNGESFTTMQQEQQTCHGFHKLHLSIGIGVINKWSI